MAAIKAAVESATPAARIPRWKVVRGSAATEEHPVSQSDSTRGHLTDVMLAQAQDRIEAKGWSNISLLHADAADFDFPTEVDAILSTYALTQVPECAQVIAHGAAALSGGGRWVVLDLKVPANVPGWLARLGTAIVRPFASIDERIMRRPSEAVRAD